MRTLLLVALAGICTLCTGVPVETPLHTVSYKNDFMAVKAQHHPHVISLDQAPLTSVGCSGQHVDLFFHNAEDASDFADVIRKHQQDSLQDVKLVGHNHLGCVDEDGAASTVVRRTLSAPKVEDNKVSIQTKQAKVNEVLKNADASLLISPQGSTSTSVPPGSHCSVVDIVKGTCTTDIRCAKDFTGWSWSEDGKVLWDEVPTKGVNLQVTCTECHFTLSPFTLAFDLQIVNNKVHNMSMSITVDLDMGLVLTAEATAAYNLAKSKQLALLKPKQVQFYVGAFPVVLDWSIPVSTSMNGNFNAQASVTGGYTATGSAEVGVYYDGQGGVSKSYTYTPQVYKPTLSHSDQGHFQATLEIKPTVKFVDFGSIEFDMDNTFTANLNGLQVTSSAEAKGTVVGTLNLDFDNHELFGPKTYSHTVYDINQQLYPPAAKTGSLLDDTVEAEMPSHIPQKDVDLMVPHEMRQSEVPTHEITHSLDDKLSYTVQHHDNVVSLDFTRGVKKVVCGEDRLHVHFQTQESAQQFTDLINNKNGAKLTGHPALGCIVNGKNSTVLHRVTSTATVSPHLHTISAGSRATKAIVEVPVVRAKPTEVVKHMKVKVDRVTPPSVMHKPTVAHQSELLSEPFGFHHLIHHVSHDIDHAASDVKKTVTKAAPTVSKDVNTAASTVKKTVTKNAPTVSKDVDNAASTVKKTVTKNAPTVGKDVNQAAKTVSKDANQAAKTVSKDATQAGKDVNQGIQTVKHDAQAVEAEYKVLTNPNSDCSVQDVLKGTCTTEIDCTHTFTSLGFDFSGRTLFKAGPLSVTCTSCFAKFTPLISLIIDIVKDDIEEIQTFIEADYAAELLVTADANVAVGHDFTLPIFTVKVPAMTFMIGVFPLQMQTEVPIMATGGVHAQAHLNAYAGAGVNGQFKAGFYYKKHEGLHKIWHPPTLNHQLYKPTMTITAGADVNVGIVSNIQVTIDDVVTASANANAKLDMPFTFVQATKDINGELDATVDVSLNGKIGVKLEGHDIGPSYGVGPWNLYSWKKELWNGTYHL